MKPIRIKLPAIVPQRNATSRRARFFKRDSLVVLIPEEQTEWKVASIVVLCMCITRHLFCAAMSFSISNIATKYPK